MNDNTKEFYISQTTNKYLSTTISDMKRRKSKLTENIFNGDYTITLLEVMKTTNLHFAKNRVNELIKVQKAQIDTTSIKSLDGRGKHTKEECDECESQEETEDTEDSEDEEDEEEEVKPKKKTEPKKELAKYKCVCCDKDEYVKNKTRHEKTNKHIANELKHNKK
jgi:myo-inositol-1-phosphate synthase